MEPQGSKGPLVAIVIVVLILIAGGVYMMKSRGAYPEGTPATEQTQSTSDEVSTLEADAQAGAGVDSLDADLQALDQELGS